jgi:hypothetical protein
MRVTRTARGFPVLLHEAYPDSDQEVALAQASSIIYDYPGALEKPGSSALWIGRDHHLRREEVAAFVGYLTRWLATGKLSENAGPVASDPLPRRRTLPAPPNAE